MSATLAAGYFFSLTRRVGGSLVVCILHGLWDFALFTIRVSDPTGRGAVMMVVASVVLLILAAATLRKVFPKHSAARGALSRGSPEASLGSAAATCSWTAASGPPRSTPTSPPLILRRR